MATEDPEITEPPPGDYPVLGPGAHTYTSVTDQISGDVLKRPWQKGWILGLAISFGILNMLMIAVAYLFYWGVGVWGIKTPVMWGFAIVNFVWWIGIGHAGTLISAILLLMKQEWRTSINRFAEAMTLFAVSCAGMFPILHLGRPWLFYWLMPYANTMGMWPQWRSPLIWDVFAVTTYATVSLLFWYVGLVPDLANLRDRARNKFAKIGYGMAALGWRGSARHWSRYQTIYVLLAGLSTPLVVSVHTIVSFDFAVGVVPGWHTTIFPPYFVAGAIYSGFAMVVTLMLPLRYFYNLRAYITEKHMDSMAKIMLATGLLVAYGYGMEYFMAWYGDNTYEKFLSLDERVRGYYSRTYAMLILFNILAVQCFWFKWVRTNVYVLWFVSIIINIGMWLERYVIIIVSLQKDFLVSSWNVYHGTKWDYMTYFGTIGLFATLIFLFVRFLPAISITEMKELVHQKQEQAHSRATAARAAGTLGGGTLPGAHAHPEGGHR